MTPEFAVSRLPEDIIKNYPEFANFIRVYYKWNLEQGFNRIVNNSRSLLYQQSYSKEYEDRVIKNLGIDISIIEDSPIKTELLYKMVNEFLETRGTATSFSLLFSTMFNKKVSITYPRDTLFKTSASNYLRTTRIIISGNYPLSIYSKLRGIRSNVSTGIEFITPFYINNNRYYIVECNNVFDSFTIAEPIEITNLSYGYNEVHIPCIDVDIINPGILYKKGDVLIPSSNLFDGNFVVSAVSKGTIDSVTIINGGDGYKVGDKVIIDDRNGHFDASVSGITLEGTITKVKIRNKGYNYDHLPNATIKSEIGKDAIIKLGTTTIGNVIDIKISEGGIVYDNKNITYTIDTKNGTGLVIKNKAVSGYINAQYTDKVGMLGYSRIMSSDNYHSHAYNITSEVPASKYSNIIDKYVNPTGYVYNKMYEKINKITIPILEASGELIREQHFTNIN